MHLTLHEFLQSDETTLLKFLERKLPEDQFLDYKVSYGTMKGQPKSGSNGQHPDSAKGEFLKDITGFANNAGGLIIYGVCEPSEDLSPVEQLTGVQGGADVATSLERQARDGCDPPLPGLQFKTVLLRNKNHAIMVYVPNSAQKPHRVSSGSKSGYYIRGSESTFPMRASEVNATVLGAAQRKTEVSNVVDTTNEHMSQRYLRERPGFILQALPVLEIETPWPVTEEQSFSIAIKGIERHKGFAPGYGLASMPAPEITLAGLQGRESRGDENAWMTEVTEFGHINACFWAVPHKSELYFHSYLNHVFCAFGSLVDEVLLAAGQQLSMQIHCSYINTLMNTRFFHREEGGSWSNKIFDDPVLEWASLSAPAGSSAELVCSDMGKRLYRAFGLSTANLNLPVRSG